LHIHTYSFLLEVLENAPQAVSQFFGPDAIEIGDELCEKEGIGYTECDLNRCVEAKLLHDVVGGHQRYDTFNLKIIRKRDASVEWR